MTDQDLSIANSQASLPLNNLKGDSAYYAVVTPATSQGKVSNSTVEAEYARHNGTAKMSTDNNASNSHIVGNVGNGANNWFQFDKVTVPEDGSYTLTIGYVQWEYTANNTWQIVNRWADRSVNGETSKHLVFANTRG